MCTVMLSRPSAAARRAAHNGQALVEFALVIPVFLVIVFSVIQFGMIMGGQEGVASAVREATRYASTVPVSNTSDSGTCSAGTGAQTYSRLLLILQQKVPGYVLANLVKCGDPAPASSVTYCYRTNPDSTFSVWVQVRAVYRHALYVPLINGLVDGLDGQPNDGLRGIASEQMRVEIYTLASTTPGGFPPCSP